MGHDSWITGIYNVYDGRFLLLEAQDNILSLQSIIAKHLGNEYLWDSDGKYKIKLKDEYSGYRRENVTGNLEPPQQGAMRRGGDGE